MEPCLFLLFVCAHDLRFDGEQSCAQPNPRTYREMLHRSVCCVEYRRNNGRDLFSFIVYMYCLEIILVSFLFKFWHLTDL